MLNGDTIIFIYGLVDPRTDIIRYIGWTINPKRRLRDHLSSYNLKKNTHKNSWIKQLLCENLRPNIIILEENVYTNFSERERYWIKYYKENNLTNLTMGGEGMLGFVHSEEFKKNNSELKKGNKNMLGKHHSQETKEIISRKSSANGLGRKVSEETKIKISESNKGKHREWVGRKHSEESKEKMRKPSSQEEIEKMRGLKRSNATSKYIGVSWDSERKKWFSKININGRQKFIGRYDSEIDAAEAYNDRAIALFGRKAKLNTIERSEDK